jgi:ectoine hydroxylase-related dioxygenase (phytanoyl-CoA dioxygenase family)
VWAKNARDPAFVTWHQDSAYFGYEPMDVWGAWVGLTDSLIEHGCLRYLPGTHLRPEMRHIETYHQDNLLQRGQQIPDFDETGAVDAEVRAGEATLHHFRLAHSSKPNASAHRRIGILFVYCPTHVRPTLGRYPARLVRGSNRYDHWDVDPLPKADLDPEAVAYFERFLGRYNDPAVRSEAERQGRA